MNATQSRTGADDIGDVGRRARPPGVRPRIGLSDTDIALARQGTATDPRIAAIVAFAPQVTAAPAEITDEQVAELREYGYSDEQIAEVAGLVALQVVTGGFNLMAGIDAATPGEARA